MKKLLLLLFLVSSVVAKAAITTPYPESIVISQINSAEKERVRLCQGHKKYDKQPTGFYIEAGKKVEVNVEILTPADLNVMPVLTVGTMGFNVDGRNTGVSTTLKAGVNTITASAGGLIWLSFINDGTAAPKGQARITFTENSQHVRAPYYVYGVTTDLEFYEMWNTYVTPDVVYYSDYIAVAATREAARLYSCYNREGVVLKEWMEAIHTLLAKEDEISGLDNSDPNPLHHRMKAGEVRFLLVENTSANPHASSIGYTGYPSSSRSRYLTKIGVPGNNTWMLGHELGHQHQQPVYQINLATESTVNIYSYVVERNIQGPNYNRTSADRWKQAQNTYLKLPVAKRVYDMPNDQLTAITKFNQDELRFMTWEQMFLIFGDQFYKTLHRVVREEKMSSGSVPDERRAYLIWKASQISGYDLTEYYNQWGIRVTDAEVKAKLRARIGNALATGAIVPLPVTTEECVMITGQNKPAWAPLPLIGITTSFPENATAPIDRSKWTITTSLDGASDATVGGSDPNYIIDGVQTSAFAYVKPGVTYGGITAPADYEPSFTVDMKSEQPFNYISYMHRTAGNNTSTYIRARQLSVYGSNDNLAFTPLNEHYAIDYVKNLHEIIIEFPQVSYRYVKVVIEDWDRANGSTIQVAEFNAGSKTPAETLPAPAPLQFSVNVTANDLIITSQRGVSLADEDSDYTVDFTLDPAAKVLTVTVDGDPVTPALNGDVYSLTVKVTNHTDINLSAESVTGLESLPVQPQVNIYPNPVKAGQPFNINLGDGFSDAVVNIYSALGEKLSEKKISNGFGEQTIYKPGMYIIEVKKNEYKRVFKFIVN